jgi:hypothetical protein
MTSTKSTNEIKTPVPQKETIEHVNAIIATAIGVTLDAATAACKCSVCKTLRDEARHVRALMQIGQRVKHIEVAK